MHIFGALYYILHGIGIVAQTVGNHFVTAHFLKLPSFHAYFLEENQLGREKNNVITFWSVENEDINQIILGCAAKGKTARFVRVRKSRENLKSEQRFQCQEIV